MYGTNKLIEWPLPYPMKIYQFNYPNGLPGIAFPVQLKVIN